MLREVLGQGPPELDHHLGLRVVGAGELQQPPKGIHDHSQVVLQGDVDGGIQGGQLLGVRLLARTDRGGRPR